MLIGISTVVAYTLSGDAELTTDNILVSLLVGQLFPGGEAMTSITALCFTALSGPMLVRQFKPNYYFVSLLASMPAGLSIVSIIGYFSGIDHAQTWGDSHMAIHTAIAMMLLSVTVIASCTMMQQKNTGTRDIWIAVAISITLLVIFVDLFRALIAWEEQNLNRRTQEDYQVFSNALNKRFELLENSFDNLSSNLSISNSNTFPAWERDNQQVLANMDSFQAFAIINKQNQIVWSQISPKNKSITEQWLKDAATGEHGNLFSRRAGLSKANPSLSLIELSTPVLMQDEDVVYYKGIIDLESLVLLVKEALALEQQYKITLVDAESNLLYEDASVNNSVNLAFEQRQTLLVNGDIKIDIAFTPYADFIQNQRTPLPLIMLLGGLLMLGLLVYLFRLRTITESKARSLEQEINEHHRTRNELQKQQTRLQTTLDNMAEALILLDANKKILSFNNAAQTLLGYSESDALGLSVSDLIPSFTSEFNADHLDSVDEDEPLSSKSLETIAIKLNGQAVPIEMSVSRFIHNNEHFFSATIKNIAHRQAQEELKNRYTQQLLRSNKELDEFAYVASHDLRSPLRAITQLASWVESDIEGFASKETSGYLQLMQSRITRLDRLLDDLLTYAKAGRKNGEFSLFNTTNVCENVFNLLEHPQSFALKLDKDLPTFTTLSTPLELIFRNLINNAIKHNNNDQGWVKVSASDNGRSYTFIISDNGPGIAPVDQTRIFQLFQTLKSRDEVEGSGMGLAMVKKIIDRFEGKIVVESDGRFGTSISFTWPKQQHLEKMLNEIK
ncbi:PAS domain S-box protein [Glaciecola sp. XM2]|jgi:PAS domain S-box-containing protein|uniref:sensor histidine kinase n=1 Tax=Glaciecola sp. XM2 TaxID=1914931 RepID=UPI001BDE1E2D|nr:ATP-binding protein [Glaciecola sp. XM2]MBT1449864.1 PAS domain S-box protein [Glaciecola sp. XM2]